MLNGFFPLGNNLFLGNDSGLEFVNLGILPANLITIPLGYVSQSIYTVLLKCLVAVLCIHESNRSAQGLSG
jgi:hypothetical protein